MHARWLLMIITMVSALAISSCDKDDEDDELSNLRVELCDLKTASAKTAVSCVLDDDRMLTFATPLGVTWATTPDSVYRALLYYNNVSEQVRVVALAATSVPCMIVRDAKDSKWSSYADPVDFVSAWIAKNGKYLNLCLSLKNGAAEDGQAHKVAVVCDSVGSVGYNKHYYYRFCHSQGEIPTYYSVERYLSVPIDSITKGDTVTMTVPTFKGMVVRDYVK